MALSSGITAATYFASDISKLCGYSYRVEELLDYFEIRRSEANYTCDLNLIYMNNVQVVSTEGKILINDLSFEVHFSNNKRNGHHNYHNFSL